MNSELQHHIENKVKTTYDQNELFRWQSVGGGSINEAHRMLSETNSFFVKTNSNNVFANGFIDEVKGLNFLRQLGVPVPEIVVFGEFNDSIYLVLTWIESVRESDEFWNNFGIILAGLHKQTQPCFGLDHDNFMGQLPQNNSPYNDFIDFFVNNRLQPQVRLAFDNGLLNTSQVKAFDKVYVDLENRLPKEEPAALHGDLWSGNFICGPDNKAYLIDPAVYYGHREIDLAMTKLFGGFSQEFYCSYNRHFPLTPGFEQRQDYYNLYPLLIHLNLFGTSYLGAVIRIVSKF